MENKDDPAKLTCIDGSRWDGDCAGARMTRAPPDEGRQKTISHRRPRPVRQTTSTPMVTGRIALALV
jgi:hypothetical protein